VAITDPDTALAFRVAGIETLSIENDGDAARVIADVSSRPGIGMILITEHLAAAAGERFQDILGEKSLPLFIEIPDVSGQVLRRRSVSEEISDLLRR